MIQQHLFQESGQRIIKPLKGQLLKWVGNKQRFAAEIISYFPDNIEKYFEPFLGSGAVLTTLAHEKSFGSDAFGPLLEIWLALKRDPDLLKGWYADRWNLLTLANKREVYDKILASYNDEPNGADLVFLCRSCYGGVVRFRQIDGYMSTPCGVHNPIRPEAFSRRVDEWHRRVPGADFAVMDYADAMSLAKKGDFIYCDPPYSHSQAILFGAQGFEFNHLIQIIAQCKARGADVALSIDGTKRSGDLVCNIEVPKGLFEREIFIHGGRSMLKRFQMNGKSLEKEVVADRLLLTY